MKNRLREIIIDYLKFSKNYLYFTNNLTSASSFIEKNSKIYTHAKLSIDKLKPSLCYLIQKHEDEKNSLKDQIDIIIMQSKNAKSFRSHDYKLIMEIQRESGKYSFSKYTGKNIFEDRLIVQNAIALLLLEILGEIEINDSALIHYFKDKKTEPNIAIDDLYNIGEEIIKYSNMEYMSTLYNYAKNIASIYQKFKEQGVFLTVDIVHDIYRSESSLFEINQFALTKPINEIKENKNSANSMFYTNEINLNDYLDRTTNDYSDSICYFNPFILENKKFMQCYLRLVEKFEKTNKAQDMKYSFLHLLSNIQYIVTDLQQYNLHCDLMISQKISFPSFVKESIENYKTHANLSDIDKVEELLYLEYINEYINKNKLKNYNNISIKDIGCGGFDQKSKIKAEKLLKRILTAMLKTKEYTLAKMYKTFTGVLIEILREHDISISKEDKIFIGEIIMYLIFEDLNFHEFDNTTYYNGKFKKVYDSYKNTNIQNRLVASDLQNI